MRARTAVVTEEWIPAKDSPLGKRRTLALARAGVLESSRPGKCVLIRRASLERYLAEHTRVVPATVEDEDLFGAKRAA